MKSTCNIIRDLLPLYMEGMASKDSCALIEKHMDQCAECKNELEEMKAFNTLPIDTDFSPLLKIKSTLRKKKIQTILFTMMLSVVMGVIAIAFFTAPEYIPYSEESVRINEIGNGTVLAEFGDSVSGYDITKYPAENDEGYVYHLTTWDSIWNRTMKQSPINHTILNPNDENVVAVYYYFTDGREDTLIYGEDLQPNGGVVSLPRLFLSYYALIAGIGAVICGLIIVLFRRNKKVVNRTMKVLFLPLSYLLGQLLLKGFTTSSYAATRDFYAILLLMIPLYIAFLIASNLIREYKNKKKSV